MNRDREFFINMRFWSQGFDSLFYAVVIGFSKFCVNFAELSIHTYFNQWIFPRDEGSASPVSHFFFFFVILRVKLLVLLAIIQKFLLILRWK